MKDGIFGLGCLDVGLGRVVFVVFELSLGFVSNGCVRICALCLKCNHVCEKSVFAVCSASPCFIFC